jgi:hypothetical protein
MEKYGAEMMLSIGKESIANEADFPQTAEQKLVFASLKDKLNKIDEAYKLIIK